MTSPFKGFCTALSEGTLLDLAACQGPTLPGLCLGGLESPPQQCQPLLCPGCHLAGLLSEMQVCVRTEQCPGLEGMRQSLSLVKRWWEEGFEMLLQSSKLNQCFPLCVSTGEERGTPGYGLRGF